VRIAVVVALAIGCKGKPTVQEPPPAATGSAKPAPGPGVSESDLPQGPGTPPNKSSPYNKMRGQKLSELAFPKFETRVRGLTDKLLDVRYLTEPRPKVAVTITVQPCFSCLPMDVDKWKENVDGLKLLVQPELRDRPDTDFDVGQTDLHGAPMIYTFQAGYLVGQDKSNNPVGAYTDAYALYYNDGITQIRVVAEYKDDPPGSKDQMLATVPRASLEKVAKAFADAYTHAW
jgi:hypothetical protein